MPTRRQFLLSAAGATVLLTVNGCADLSASDNAVQSATAITRVFGDGMRLVAVRLTYRHDVDAAALDKAQFQVAERNITDISASGRHVTLALNPNDAAALLTVKQGRPAGKAGGDPAKNGPGKAGEKQPNAAHHAHPQRSV